ncbi:MAG: B12-binding domain-containing radical SAM protein, partial [Deltaproteobacteria bacterium]|nr:B12-binding domain-containing radical SAM protein [Deltaproteobacteria bacterium]
MHHSEENRLNRFRVFKPLGLMTLGSLTPPEWQVTLIDENIAVPDYASSPIPDLVGITAFTSQAARAYELAAGFRQRGVAVVMGGIHASMCADEAARHVDAVVRGEAEEIWKTVLDDAARGALRPIYEGGFAAIEKVPPARQDLASGGYLFGAIQVTRGCPLNCSFCSVTAFNGRQFRRRAIPDVVDEMRSIREKYILVVDDNLIGTSSHHMAYAKELFRALIDARLDKRWICQATVNLAEDEELLALAARSGCRGVLIGFESLSAEGLTEVNKKFNFKQQRDIREVCRRIQRHGIAVLANFIIGLDADKPGVGSQIAEAAIAAGVEMLHVQMLTPLPGTVLWNTLRAEDRIAANVFPDDWQYYTFTYPVARCRHLSAADLVHEFTSCFRAFYSPPCILRRLLTSLFRSRGFVNTLVCLIANLAYRGNLERERRGLERYLASAPRLARALPPSSPSPVTAPT